MKRCSKCKVEQPETNFTRDAKRPDGLFPQCKDCTRAYRQANAEQVKAYRKAYQETHKEQRKAYLQRNAERERKRQKEYDTKHAERIAARRKARYWANLDESRKYSREVEKRRRVNNPDGVNAAAKRWRDQNVDKIRERTSQYRKKNRNKIREYERRSRATNREKHRQKCRIRRARRFAQRAHFTVRQWETLKAEYEYRCLCCGKAEPDIKLQPDHVIPLARGGDDSIRNIQPLCGPCNISKGAKTRDYRPHRVEQLAFW